MTPPVPDRSVVRSAIETGQAVRGWTQLDDYSCGVVAAFSIASWRAELRGKGTLKATHYRDAYRKIKPSRKWGSQLTTVRRAVPGVTRYGRFRRPEVLAAFRRGQGILAAIAWPTEEEPELLHYVLVTAMREDGMFLTLNNAGNPGRSAVWRDWDDLREGADDQTLVFGW